MKRVLSRHSVRCTVLTSHSCLKDKNNDSDVISIRDPFRREKASPRVHSLRKFNILPDTMLFWSLSAAAFIIRHAKEYDRVLLTAPPYSLPLLLSLSAGEHTMKKCSLDIRDLWSLGSLRDYGITLMKYSDIALESFVFSRFSMFSAVTKRNASEISKRHKVKVETVYNTASVTEQYDAGNMLHPCVFYGGKIDKIRFNEKLFEALRIAAKRYGLHAYIAGDDPEGLAAPFGSEFIHLLGSVPRERALWMLKEADAGIIMHSYSLKDFTNVFTYKISDFISLKKPVFYTGPATEVSDFIKEFRIGTSVNYENDPDKIAEILYRHIGTDFKYSRDASENFSENNLLRIFYPVKNR